MTGKVQEILDEVDDSAEGAENVSVGDLMADVGHRGYGPFLMLPALLEITPAGAIPGVPTILALIIATFAAQIAFGRKSLWLPDWLEKREVSSDKLEKSIDKLRPVGRWMDRWFKPRWESLTSDFATRIAMGVVLALCLTVPPLEMLPFASSGPMLAIAVFGLAVTVKDGLLMAAGYVVTAIAVPMILYLAM